MQWRREDNVELSGSKPALAKEQKDNTMPSTVEWLREIAIVMLWRLWKCVPLEKNECVARILC